MPKRKRSSYDDASDGNGNRVLKMRKKDVEDRLSPAKKQLHRALKTAKGFERQKLGKRLKLATTAGETDQVQRINTEIKMLKGLDLQKVAESQLYKTLKKVKSFVGSGLLPEYVMSGDVKPEGDGITEEEIVALRNVTSGMFNIKNVKDIMKVTIGGMYIALGIPKPEEKSGKKQALKEGSKDRIQTTRSEASSSEVRNESGINEDEHEEMLDGSDELSWEGFDDEDEDDASGVEDGSGSDSDGDEGEYGSDLEEEEFSKWDALLVGSSDEESFDEETYKKSHPAHQPQRSLSLSPSPSPSPSPSLSSSSSQSMSHSHSSPPPSSTNPNPARASKSSKSQSTPKPIGGSTFLPTLMGGYWSGSESASDLEDDPATATLPIRKNRKGQQARRAIWEKKYGTKAKHVVNGLGKEKDDGWDAKRGAKDSSGDWKSREGARVGARGGRGRNFATVTGENAIAVTPRNRTTAISKKRDDVGTLHPSWLAAKKAKEMKKTATFQGKKVVFD
ncbi:hypothetical protein B7463_g11624, partial [Scytalidium lignicola]